MAFSLEESGVCHVCGEITDDLYQFPYFNENPDRPAAACFGLCACSYSWCFKDRGLYFFTPNGPRVSI